MYPVVFRPQVGSAPLGQFGCPRSDSLLKGENPVNNIKRMLVILTAVAFAAFALPGVAGNDKKMYSLNMAILTSPPAAPPYTVTAAITNQGNSTINSFNLSVTGLTIVGVNQPATGNATFTESSVSVNNMHPLKSGDSLTVTIGVSSCGEGTWSATVWTGAHLNGQTFAQVPEPLANLATTILCGQLNAGDLLDVPNSLTPHCITGERGFYDKDGGVRGGLPYVATNFGADLLHFKWPDSTIADGVDALATFEYEVCAPGPAPAAGTTQVAWLNTNGHSASESGTPAFITAQNCNVYANFLPQPYGTLVSVSEDGTTITVNVLSILDPLGVDGGPFDPLQPNGTIKHPVIDGESLLSFDIVIDGERMTVTNVVSDENQAGDLSDSVDLNGGEGLETETWTVTRAVGGTTQTVHTAGGLVMSTPLPLITADVLPNPNPANYVVGHPALMCIADQDPGFDEGDETEDPATGHSTTFIDIGGDGWNSHP